MTSTRQAESVFHPQKYRSRNRVRELRENKLMTQVQLAKKARVAVRTIQSIERGMRCRMDTKRKVLLALDLSLEQRHQVFLNSTQRRTNT